MKGSCRVTAQRAYDFRTMSEGSDHIARGVDAVEDAVESAEILRTAAVRIGWFRIEYAILATLGLLFAAYVLAYFVFGIDLDRLKDWGYLGIFFLAMAGSATIVLPTPSNLAIFGSSTILDPIFGVPAPLLVGIVAGLGDAIGEFSGYGLGYAGTDLVRHQKVYATFERWMDRNGIATIFFLSTFPNPFFDLVGTAAGASRMPALRFFIACLCGKIVKDLFLAYGGSFSIGLVRDAF
jgi:membrane protein YqaA with SNARE-associated domain